MNKTPSFRGLNPASETASRVKRSNRRSNTLHELTLRRALWHSGLRYRINVSHLPGKPDIVFPRQRVAVFCDGDFWHGRNWSSLKSKLERGTNSSYWPAKIARNIERDERNTALLREAGWEVIRLWETDIRRDPVQAADVVRSAVQFRGTAPSAIQG